MNQGLTGEEIAEAIALPPVLASKWYNRGYYGTMRHNAKAVYQRYLGWYDANPANLNGWPPEEAGKRYVAAMGGPKAALKTARQAYAAGDYRWSAEVASRIVFADAGDKAAREVLAKGAPFKDWKNNPFLALRMYIQLRDAFGWDTYKRVFSEYRALKPAERPRGAQRHDVRPGHGGCEALHRERDRRRADGRSR